MHRLVDPKFWSEFESTDVLFHVTMKMASAMNGQYGSDHDSVASYLKESPEIRLSWALDEAFTDFIQSSPEIGVFRLSDEWCAVRFKKFTNHVVKFSNAFVNEDQLMNFMDSMGYVAGKDVNGIYRHSEEMNFRLRDKSGEFHDFQKISLAFVRTSYVDQIMDKVRSEASFSPWLPDLFVYEGFSSKSILAQLTPEVPTKRIAVRSETSQAPSGGDRATSPSKQSPRTEELHRAAQEEVERADDSMHEAPATFDWDADDPGPEPPPAQEEKPQPEQSPKKGTKPAPAKPKKAPKGSGQKAKPPVRKKEEQKPEPTPKKKDTPTSKPEESQEDDGAIVVPGTGEVLAVADLSYRLWETVMTAQLNDQGEDNWLYYVASVDSPANGRLLLRVDTFFAQAFQIETETVLENIEWQGVIKRILVELEASMAIESPEAQIESFTYYAVDDLAHEAPLQIEHALVVQGTKTAMDGFRAIQEYVTMRTVEEG